MQDPSGLLTEMPPPAKSVPLGHQECHPSKAWGSVQRSRHMDFVRKMDLQQALSL